MPKHRFVAFLVASAAVLLLSLPGCKEKVGGKCLPGQAVCSDNALALTCGTDSKYAAMQCRGPKGCARNGGTILCDNSVAQLNDGCNEENDVACAVDKKAALECHGGKFVTGETCKGQRGCEIKADKINCDNDISDVDDPCHFDGDYACTPDKVYVLKCIGKKMTKLNSCRGTKGCRVFELPEEKKIEFVCDDSIAQLNDPCDEEGEHACSMDKKSIYICKGAVFTAFKPCGGPKGCTFDEKGEKFECDATTGPGKPVDVKQPTPPGIPQKPGAKPRTH
jgi:hypothetical protein